MQITSAQRHLALTLATLLACAIAFAAFASMAFAEGEGPDTTTPGEHADLQQRASESAEAYNQALARVDDVQRRIDENTARISEVEAALPLQRKKAETAMVAMYKLSGNSSLLTGLLMGAESLGDFLQAMEYLTGITAGNIQEISKLKSMQTELSTAEIALKAEKEEAVTARDRAEAALAEAQAARQAAQQAALDSISDAEVEAFKRQAEDAMVAQAVEQGISEEEARSQAQEAVAQIDVKEVKAAAGGDVDWSMSKSDFINEWTTRIDAYLEGSPLAGQGGTFASAAWENGVDPRWSPAIANTESTKGQYTFMDHNAWGWGSSSWSNWEDAINDHVEGLAKGYGSTITQEGAAKYCPPTADEWYSTTLNQMNQI